MVKLISIDVKKQYVFCIKYLQCPVNNVSQSNHGTVNRFCLLFKFGDRVEKLLSLSILIRKISFLCIAEKKFIYGDTTPNVGHY